MLGLFQLGQLGVHLGGLGGHFGGLGVPRLLQLLAQRLDFAGAFFQQLLMFNLRLLMALALRLPLAPVAPADGGQRAQQGHDDGAQPHQQRTHGQQQARIDFHRARLLGGDDENRGAMSHGL